MSILKPRIPTFFKLYSMMQQGTNLKDKFKGYEKICNWIIKNAWRENPRLKSILVFKIDLLDLYRIQLNARKKGKIKWTMILLRVERCFNLIHILANLLISHISKVRSQSIHQCKNWDLLGILIMHSKV
jgi:hypothetical protein